MKTSRYLKKVTLVTGLMSHLRKSVSSALWKDKKIKPKGLDNSIALGVLLRGMGAVAEADGKFRSEEGANIEKIILARTNISKADLPIVLTAIRQSSFGRNEFYGCVRSISRKLIKRDKISLIEDFFRVACSDKKLSDNEMKVITKVSRLLNMTSADLNCIKERIKAECS